MDWDDLRFVAAVVRHGSLLRAARELRVEHTTVGRRIEAAEQSLGAKLFARSTKGLVLTSDGERLVGSLQRVEEAVAALERRASAEDEELRGSVRVTAPETFGIAWLAPRLATFARAHPNLHIDLDPSGQILDLDRRQAEIAFRFFRSKQKSLLVRRVAEVAHGLYASRAYVNRHSIHGPRDLQSHPLLTVPPGSVEATWFSNLVKGKNPAFSSTVTVALVGAAKLGAGIAVLPRYVGDVEAELVHLPMPAEPREPLFLTVHQDLRGTPRVRALIDYLLGEFEREARVLSGGQKK